MKTYKKLAITRQGAIATVTLNTPETRNAVDLEMHGELESVWPGLAADRSIRAIVLTGAGDAFSTGGDIGAMARRGGTPEALIHALKIPAMTRRLFSNILETPQPIIAAVNGHATGLGATLALFADVSVISETAKFGDSHVKVGLVAGDGGAVIWPLLIGPNRAKELLMKGQLVSGHEAHAMGLINHVAPASEVLARAMALAEDYAALPPLALQWTKMSVNRGIKVQMEAVLDLSISLEMMSMITADHAEATQAIVEKRTPSFKGV